MSLVAGDPSTQSLINRAVLEKTFVDNLTVADAVDIYVDGFVEIRRSLAETSHLKPLGLTNDSFLAKQHGLDPQVVEELVHRLRHESLEAETIIAGVDQKGAHIYAVHDPGIPRCHDNVGFVAIGSGQRHAESAVHRPARTRQHIPSQREPCASGRSPLSSAQATVP